MTATGAAVAAPPTAATHAGGRVLPGWAGLLAAAGCGAALLLAFPPYDLWWLAPGGVALLAVATHRRRVRAGAGLGLLAGLVLFVPLLSWTGLHVGPVPWLLLAGLEAAFLALLGALAAFASPLVERYGWAWAPLTGVLWVAQEALRDRAPFGGFPWGRLAFAQGGSPLLRVAALGGAPLVTFAVALCGGLLAAAGWRLAERGRPARWRPAGAARWPVLGAGWAAGAGLTAGAVLVVLSGLAVPLAAPAGEPVTVAVVQGNVPRLGLDFNAQRRAVLDNHVQASLVLANDVLAGRTPQPDLVVWPENSSDIDPTRNADAYTRIDLTARALAAPVLVGAVLDGPRDGTVHNAGVVWLPGSGPGPTYLKRHPAPFAEYLPLRPVVEPVARAVTEEAKLLRSDFVPGSAPGVLAVGPTVVGDVICFEVAYDDVVRDTVDGGAQLLVVQTNNATFNVAEARQQLAMVRLRAVEHGRDSLMASTVGVSGFVTADGVVHDATEFNTQAVVVRELAPATARTLATRLGTGPEWVLVVAASGALVAAAVLRRRERPSRAGRDRAEPDETVRTA
ncbi:MAG TPA: apolipoprotein N-acyltransferase [Micromonosporaceae bacterium]|nr:apolipoprotein N-acyltransferase [Micromonosporaceae bacterium]